MTLPFTLEQFLDVFAAYNRALWPAALVLWGVTAAVMTRLAGRGRQASVAVGLLLAAHWLWSGVAYHLAFFRSINPAAAIFGVLFVAQAALFAWRSLRAPVLAFDPRTARWPRLGIALIAYAFLYPAIGVAAGLTYPRMPTFGVPCPTTILTIGALLLVQPSSARWLAVIPLLWSAIGGSAAFLFGVRADLMLIVAGVALIVHVLQPDRGSPAAPP